MMAVIRAFYIVMACGAALIIAVTLKTVISLRRAGKETVFLTFIIIWAAAAAGIFIALAGFSIAFFRAGGL